MSGPGLTDQERAWVEYAQSIDAPPTWREAFAAGFDAARGVSVQADDDELESLRRWKAEAMTVMAGLQEVGQALGLPLGEQITGRAAVDAALDLRNRAESVQAADEPRFTDAERAAYLQGYEFALRNFRDEPVQADYRRLADFEVIVQADAGLRAAVERLADEWEALANHSESAEKSPWGRGYDSALFGCIADVRAALAASPAPTEDREADR